MALSVIGSGAQASTGDDAATRAMFARVIAIPTVLGRGKVPEMAAYLAGEFRSFGWADSDVEVVPYDTGNPDGSGIDPTAALIVRWRAPASPAQRPILVMGYAQSALGKATAAAWVTAPAACLVKIASRRLTAAPARAASGTSAGPPRALRPRARASNRAIVVKAPETSTCVAPLPAKPAA